MIAWLRPAQAAFVRAVAQAADFAIVGAGTPSKGQSAAVADALSCAAVADIRTALTEGDAELIFIASTGDFGADAAADAGALAAARARSVQVATLDPIPAAALDVMAREWSDGELNSSPSLWPRVCPLVRFARSLRDAMESLHEFGPARLVSVTSTCTAGQASLGGRLFSAVDLVLAMLGEPDLIDAAFISPGAGHGLHSLPGETHRDLHGTISANVRYADGRAANFVLSDCGAQWTDSVLLIGPGGQLTITHRGFEWFGPDGSLLDRHEAPATEHEAGAAAIADVLTRLLDPALPVEAPVDIASVLAIGQAALLSARTGQGESPATIRRMMNVS